MMPINARVRVAESLKDESKNSEGSYDDTGDIKNETR